MLDGLVYRSAGVTLNWQRPPSNEAANEIQSLRQHRRCRSCGTTDTVGSAKSEEPCRACGSSELHTSEFLRPSGFTVDPREEPHTRTDEIAFVAAEPPAVSTRDAAWRALPFPELGRIRLSREGLVYYENRGPERSGYDVCLQCGRAEPSGKNRLDGHRPLRWRKGEGAEHCDGNANTWKIKRGLALGHGITTDVVELQVPRHGLGRAGADALALALREGLARHLGVEAEEMGIAVQPRERPHKGLIKLFRF